MPPLRARFDARRRIAHIEGRRGDRLAFEAVELRLAGDGDATLREADLRFPAGDRTRDSAGKGEHQEGGRGS
jgi:hypothetical protein